MKRNVVLMAVLALITGWALTGLAQNQQKPLAAFNITVARTSEGVSLTCEKGGCAWEKLGFTVGNKPVAVNDNGMASSPDNPEANGKFLIRFSIESNNFALTCERGCAWQTLSFPATENPVPIDQFGTASKK